MTLMEDWLLTARATLFSADDGSIYEYTPDGVRSTFASGLNQPRGLAFNSAGDLFVAENGSGNIGTNSRRMESPKHFCLRVGCACRTGLR